MSCDFTQTAGRKTQILDTTDICAVTPFLMKGYFKWFIDPSEQNQVDQRDEKRKAKKENLMNFLP